LIFFFANLLNHNAVDATIAPMKSPEMLSSTPNTLAKATPPIAAPVQSGQCARTELIRVKNKGKRKNFLFSFMF